MAGRFYFIVCLFVASSVQAQFIALPGVKVGAQGATIAINSTGNVVLGDDNFDLTNANVSIALLGAGTLAHTHNTRLAIDSLRIDGGNSNLLGTWVVREQLTLKNGKFVVNPASSPSGKLLYTGDASGVSANDNSYVIGPMFTAGNHQNRLYPIGTVNGYYPAQLSGVSDATVLLRMEVFGSTPPLDINQLKTAYPDIDDLVTDRFYQFNVIGATSFAGAPIALSLKNTSPTIDPGKNKPIVVELDSLQNINDLQGTTLDVSVNNSFVQSETHTSAKGGKYMIAASKDVVIKIHKLITPNGDGWNDELKIEGIDLYPNNKVTLLDRWGGVYLTKEGFASGQSDIDYAKLVNGNYICIVEYTDSKGTHKPKPQMITVLK